MFCWNHRKAYKIKWLVLSHNNIIIETRLKQLSNTKVAQTTLYFLRNGSLSLHLATLTPPLIFIVPQARRILYVFWGWLFNSSRIVWRVTEDIIERARCKWVCGLNVMCEWWHTIFHHTTPRHRCRFIKYTSLYECGLEGLG